MTLDAGIKRLLKQVYDHFDKEDGDARDYQIKIWRKLKLLWDNLQHSYYSEVAHDWRVPDSEQFNDQSYYDKPVDIFRAYLESIIAALSIVVPPVTCYPFDADNSLDVSTAKAGDKIAKLLGRWNEDSLLWLHALFIYCTEGMMASYSYPHECEEYGTYDENEYEEAEETHETSVCPNCGFEMMDRQLDIEEPNTENDVIIDDTGEGLDFCPECQDLVTPNIQRNVVPISRIKKVNKKPKSRVRREIYGGLYVKIPISARKQEDCPYLHFMYETHFANVIERYPDLREILLKNGSFSGKTSDEQIYRLSPQYRDSVPDSNVTVNNCWYRPAAFNVLKEEDCKKLKEKFPDGVKIVVVNDEVADAIPEKLDEHWTLYYNPLADAVHFDPIGMLLVSIQEITNDLISLVLQTIEHGIGQTFANPRTIDFKAYRESEVVPGAIYPAVPPPGKALSDGFFEVSTSKLSGEVMPFATKIQEIGQLVSGALPSLFGGQVSGSRTASEYSMSRAQAQQRLQTTWKGLISWWKKIYEKDIPMQIREFKEDERDVEKDEYGNFINVFIRKADLEGKIGKVEVDADENLPITWSQQKDNIVQLFEINNDMITATLGSPENLPYMKKLFGTPGFVIPGENDRQKQYEEITQLIDTVPVSLPPDPIEVQINMTMGVPPPPIQELPSIEIDPDIDNHPIHIEICRHWLTSDIGRMCRIDNMDGYKNVLLHLKAHIGFMMSMQPPAPVNPSGVGKQKPNDPEKTPPIRGEQDVNTE